MGHGLHLSDAAGPEPAEEVEAVAALAVAPFPFPRGLAAGLGSTVRSFMRPETAKPVGVRNHYKSKAGGPTGGTYSHAA
jgi:hypothetical protein